MKIAIEDLKFICQKILHKAEKTNLKEIEVDADYYWNVSNDDIYNFSTNNPELTIGSIVDDWTWLKKILDEDSQPSIVDIERLGNILKTLSNVISDSDHIY